MASVVCIIEILFFPLRKKPTHSSQSLQGLVQLTVTLSSLPVRFQPHDIPPKKNLWHCMPPLGHHNSHGEPLLPFQYMVSIHDLT